jgi:ferredoxin/flavodoxin---NADP+ reductase
MIGTNRVDAAETVDTILRDLGTGRLPEPAYDAEHLKQLVASQQPDLVDEDAWHRIDQVERRHGRTEGRPRKKLVSLPQLLAAARAD